ncbi:hypothetical protein P3T36_000562 [Kitasatospora sp. MAP12-15]|uniref:hypothetical protein n=1 Tax=unclassified Kitasatospora TaxID=2633591 RepID=UPI002475EC62|nr:hypothetical protein [Kitasatospora sp. MAP12-44]MDH6114161.1 hypothetical protein [Kitasatospora sp. MAP12-44]
MKTLRSLSVLLLAPLLLPLQLGAMLLRVHTGRARAARAEGDRGALSIEMALIVIVVIGIAGAVLLLINNLGKEVEKKIPPGVPAGLGS